MKRSARHRGTIGWFVLWGAGLLLLQAACAGTSELTSAPEATEGVPHAVPTQGAAATQAPAPTPTEGAAATEASVPTPMPAITEARFIEVEWPAAIRVGDSDFVSLALVPGAAGQLTPTAEIAGHQTQGEPIEVPNLYDTHNVLAVAELSGVGFRIDRPGEILQALLPGEPVKWQWTLAPLSAGKQVATIDLKLRFVPKAGGNTSEKAVWARRLSIEGRTVLGLSGRAADLLGVLGTVSGGVLGFPFADKFYAWIWRRIVRRNSGSNS